MINKIAFTHYCVTDLERSLNFYQNILGLTLLFKQDNWAEFSIGGQRLAIHKVKSMDAQQETGAVVSFETQSIEELSNSLKDKGVQFAKEIQSFPYGKLASFYDPDKNVIGLYEPPPKNADTDS
ncbi:MAG: VOC family protein [Nitrospinales bacterium]